MLHVCRTYRLFIDGESSVPVAAKHHGKWSKRNQIDSVWQTEWWTMLQSFVPTCSKRGILLVEIQSLYCNTTHWFVARPYRASKYVFLHKNTTLIAFAGGKCCKLMKVISSQSRNYWYCVSWISLSKVMYSYRSSKPAWMSLTWCQNHHKDLIQFDETHITRNVHRIKECKM